MKRIRKISLLFLSAILTCSLVACSKTEDAQKEFDSFVRNDFIELVSSDYTLMHQLLEKPEKYGIDESKVKVNLGSRFDEKTLNASKKATTKKIKEFKEIDRFLLTKKQKDIYDLYAFNLEILEASNADKFDYYGSLFSSASGLHYALGTTFADYEIRDEADLKNLILLVKDVRPYIKSALAYTKKQNDLGLFIGDITSIKTHCEGIIKNKENSSILASINESIDQLQLSQDKTNAYKEELQNAFMTSFIPAYQDIYDTMNEIQKTYHNENVGLSNLKYGKEYYELLFKASIGSNKSINDVKKMMKGAYQKSIQDASFAIMSDKTILDKILSAENNTPFKDYQSILEHNKKMMFQDFPKINDTNYIIKNISLELASDSGVAAYFNIPALDATHPNQLRVNPKAGTIGSFQNFITVSHEGYPGHMYQMAYALEHIDSPYINIIGRNPAYTEGYAVYASYEALPYLGDLTPAFISAYKGNDIASYSLMILADIGIHHDGWSYDDFKEFIVNNGMVLEEEGLRQMFSQLQANPAVFQSYYVGYLEIMEIRDKIEKELGNQFKIKDFHEALLKCGALPFEQVEKHINEAMKKK